MNVLDLFFAFLLGAISIASPCVLPVVPLLFAGARGEAKNAVSLIAGLVLSLSLFGLLSSTSVAAASLIVSKSLLRIVAYVFMCIFAAFMISSRLEEKLSATLSQHLSPALSKISNSTGSSFFFGFFLSFLWMPCITPMLGIAVSIASLSGPVSSTLVMASFGIGMMTSIAIVLFYSRKFGLQNRLFGKTENLQRLAGYLILIYVAYFIYCDLNP